MQIRYDQEEDILMIETMGESAIDHAEQTGPIIAHFSRDERLVLLEILDASEFLASLIKATMRKQEQTLPMAAESGRM